MSMYPKKKKIEYQIIFLLIFLYISVLLGFILSENSSGGATFDKIVCSLYNFLFTFLNYDDYRQISLSY